MVPPELAKENSTGEGGGGTTREHQSNFHIEKEKRGKKSVRAGREVREEAYGNGR